MKRLALLALLVLTAVGAHADLPFIENDYKKAAAEAKAKNVPLVVEAWAPWCHTCRSMQAYVYTDKSLDKYASRFVWLSLNTEAAENAEFLKRYPIPALPTLLVLEPKRSEVTLRYVGGANIAQVRSMLDDAEAKHRSHATLVSDQKLAEADRLAADGKHDEAVKSYEEAIHNAPKKWPRFGRSAESLLFSLSMLKNPEHCATRALALYPRVKGTVSSANVAAIGLSCATQLPTEHAQRVTLLDSLEKATQEVFADPKIVLSDDDRSGLYIALIEARDAAGDEEGTIGLQAQWAEFLEQAAGRAKTPKQRAVYDSHRVSAYLELGMPEKAVPMLEQSERDFPDDYNPPARLALAYNAMKDYDKALAASDRALSRVYGPRKLSVLSVRADIFTGKGDVKAARDTIVEAIEYAKALPDGQRSATRIASMEKRLATMP
ncbi:MAG TPA: thioredoxin family protein [Thermoanaerobaculia bacterium]|jgi:tetratricopeptide (TPR) repeat protein|nr:thioredoxin family protein [Thermoanaerobaculia bacterium]